MIDVAIMICRWASTQVLRRYRIVERQCILACSWFVSGTAKASYRQSVVLAFGISAISLGGVSREVAQLRHLLRWQMQQAKAP